jgi:hypothetical protein
MAKESKQNELRNEGKGRIGSINHLRLMQRSLNHLPDDPLEQQMERGVAVPPYRWL